MADDVFAGVPAEEVKAPVKPVRAKRAPKAEGGEKTGVREWKAVVAEIRKMREAGSTVPEVAEALEVPYVLVNQVVLQSYKMSVDTLGVFERQEQQRVAAQQQA